MTLAIGVSPSGTYTHRRIGLSPKRCSSSQIGMLPGKAIARLKHPITNPLPKEREMVKRA
ncbi:MAG: hypothetical protein V7L29_07190 [Nostoc sp.]|uniref:hypothetical protein n=1 Tax=Nostoc sp. TaxID=1180 RepID=UPI002FF59612